MSIILQTKRGHRTAWFLFDERIVSVELYSLNYMWAIFFIPMIAVGLLAGALYGIATGLVCIALAGTVCSTFIGKPRANRLAELSFRELGSEKAAKQTLPLSEITAATLNMTDRLLALLINNKTFWLKVGANDIEQTQRILETKLGKKAEIK